MTKPARLTRIGTARCLIAILSLPLLSGSVLADDHDPIGAIMGDWATVGFGSIVRLQPCEPGQAPVELCGTIAWLWDALDDAGRPRTDANNPDKSARVRRLVGTRILSGFRLSDDGIWRGGRVYNPDDGRTYSGTVRIAGADSLELKGCALKVFCQTQTWRRAADVCSAVGTDK